MRKRKIGARAVFLLVIGLACGLVLCACAKNKVQRVEPRQALSEIDPGGKDYIKKTAVVLANMTQSPIGRQQGQQFLQNITDTIRTRSSNLRLVTAGEGDLPAFMSAWVDSKPDALVHNMAQYARMAGYQALLRASLLDMQATSEKKGFWILRKERYYMTIKATLDILDPLTAAKMASIVKEEKVTMNMLDYESFQAGELSTSADLDERTAEIAEDLGKQASKILENMTWRIAVSAVQGQRANLPAGNQDGLKVGDRLAVFEAGRHIQGKRGEAFVAPGYKIGEIQIIAVDAQTCEADIQSAADIKVDDIAVPLR